MGDEVLLAFIVLAMRARRTLNRAASFDFMAALRSPRILTRSVGVGAVSAEYKRITLVVLKQAHLVVDRAHGNRRLYELNPAGVETLRAYFDRFWDQALAVHKRAAEARAAADRV